MPLFVTAPPPSEIYTLSLHDALPISAAVAHEARDREDPQERGVHRGLRARQEGPAPAAPVAAVRRDRKSTRLNSSHVEISYAVFCLKKKKNEHVLSTHY